MRGIRRRRSLLPAAPLAAPVGGAVGASGAAAAVAAPITVDRVDLLDGAAPLIAPDAVRRSCFAKPLTAGDAGVVLKRVSAGIDGDVDDRLRGSPTGDDWDLAVFDAVTGRLLGASAAFGGNEVVQAPVANAEQLTVQSCRIDGSAAPVGLSVTETVVSGDVPAPTTESLVSIPVKSQADVNDHDRRDAGDDHERGRHEVFEWHDDVGLARERDVRRVGHGRVDRLGADGSHRLVTSRPRFFAKRTRCVGSVQLRLRLVGGGSLKGVRVTVVDARKRVLFTVKLTTLRGSSNLRCGRRRACPGCGRAPCGWSSRRPTARAVTITKASRVVR